MKVALARSAEACILPLPFIKDYRFKMDLGEFGTAHLGSLSVHDSQPGPFSVQLGKTVYSVSVAAPDDDLRRWVEEVTASARLPVPIGIRLPPKKP